MVGKVYSGGVSIMRLRQICLVAENLQTSLETLAELLGSPVVFRDPDVAHFGLENGLIMTGGDFVEVVSPLANIGDTAAGRHLARYGDGFYMAIFQCANAAPLIAHIKDNGGRGVFEIDAGGVRATHFHPKDFGAAIVSVDSMGRDDWQSPQAYWQWAHWPPENSAAPDTDTSVGALAGLRVSAGAPVGMQNHSDLQNYSGLLSQWAYFLQRPKENDRLLFDGAEIAFHEGDAARAAISDIYFHAGRDSMSAIYARAERLGLPMQNGGVSFGGVVWHFGDAPAAHKAST